MKKRTKCGYFFADVTRCCADLPAGASRVFEIRGYCSGDIVLEYGRRCYPTYFLGCFLQGDYPESGKEREDWEEYEDKLNSEGEEIEDVEVSIIQAAELCETGVPSPDRHGRSPLEKAPRNREAGETWEDYVKDVVEYLREHVRTGRVLG